ncbi:MAG: zinc-binding dehydrogenase [Spirochaetales bacterium]|nr:zinc-binding dehydrogenase [Spirochaetales bacterium]
MKTKAVRLYGKKDLRLEEFELPAIQEDEILAHIVSDSICMSSYKEALQGSDHKRVPSDIATNPIIIGHECCGEIVEVGKKWRKHFKPGHRFSIQPNMKHPDFMNGLGAPGYTFPYIGGAATYIVIPRQIMEQNCLLNYHGKSFFYGSLAEPMSCIVAAYKATFHVEENYIHHMGPVAGGNMAILAGVGPMGLGTIDYAIHAEKRPGLLVVTDIDEGRLARAASIYTVEEARRLGVELRYVNTKDMPDPAAALREITGGKGYDDVFVFAPVRPVVEQGDKILAYDGCLNFFAGPTDNQFSAQINFYDVHYASHHVVGTSGGNTDDMIESLDLMGRQVINPTPMITHVGGLNAAAPTTLNLPNIPGGKKLIYTNIDLELTAIDDFAEKGKSDPLFAELARIVAKTNNLWSPEAEEYLLEHAKGI